MLLTRVSGFLAALVAIMLTGGPAVAESPKPIYAFGYTATQVAKEGACKNLRTRSDGGQFADSGLVCDLQGKRVNILTFVDKKQEKRWLVLTCAGLPDQWITIGAGFVITARDGNKAAAKTGGRVYKINAILCSDLAG